MSQHNTVGTPNNKAFKTIGTAAGGLILFVASFALLRWNETQAVKHEKIAADAELSPVVVSPTVIDPANEGRLVLATGAVSTPDALTDEKFGISVHAVRLHRHVEMYQWQETITKDSRQELGGDSQFISSISYQQIWSKELIDSDNFQQAVAHQNPSEMPFQSRVRLATPVQLGAFELSPALTEQIEGSRPLDAALDRVSADVKRNLTEYTARDGTRGFSWTRWALEGEPQIGDVRITFTYTPAPATLSVLAKQVGNGFEPQQTKDGQQLFVARAGKLDTAEILPRPNFGQQTLVSALRLLAIVTMFAGVVLSFSIVTALDDSIPGFAEINRAGTKLVALLATAVVSLLAISSAWVLYRPLLGMSLFAAAAALASLLVWLVKRQVSWTSQTPTTLVGGNSQSADGSQVAEETLGA